MRHLLLAAFFMVLGTPLWPGPLADVLFRTGELAAATPLRFAHEQDGEAGELALAAPDAEGRMLLSLTTDDVTRPLGELPAAGGNPALLFFLERVVQTMAEETGGSPYYIRNRIREALVADERPLPDDDQQEITITPFKDDPHHARMGRFAGLQLHFVLDDRAPVQLVRLSADTGGGADGYHESLTLIAEEP